MFDKFRKNSFVSKIIKQGSKFKGNALIFSFLKIKPSNIFIRVSRKVGNAVARNRIKRRVKFLCNLYKFECSVVIMAKRCDQVKEFNVLQKDIVMFKESIVD